LVIKGEISRRDRQFFQRGFKLPSFRLRRKKGTGLRV
jgi:hypothetical protein